MKLELIQNHPLHIINRYPLLFLHGAAGAAWNFKGYLDYLETQGVFAYAMSLRGHGLSDGEDLVDHATMDDYVYDLIHVVEQLEEKPIVIGHSMGGAILQRSLKDHQELIHAAVLLSSANANGIDPNTPLGIFFSQGTQFLRDMRQTLNEPKLGIDELLRRYVLSSKITEEEMKVLRSKLSKESKVIKKDLLKPFLPLEVNISIPILVVGCLGDLIITPDKLEETAHRYQTIVHMIPGESHFLMIDKNYLESIQALNGLLRPLYL
ncbi:MAG: alpha/beta hydrolase [Acholeplasma sp.]|jgi:pimeloyl-ACP methyl ester carboxylesterase|nr:MAG: alpha/beta hydrolase [Acholeplasma sp.]